MVQKYEKVDLGNVRGKDGKDGVGILDFKWIEDRENMEHVYHVIYTDEEKEPTEVIIKDGDNTGIIDKHLENYIQKTTTTGLIRNDGTIDTTSYSTFDGHYTSLKGTPTIPVDVSDLNDAHDKPFTPKTHAHGNIQNEGYIDTTKQGFDTNDYPIIADYSLNNKITKGNVSSEHILDPVAHATLETNKNENQSVINTQINDKIRDHTHDTLYYTQDKFQFNQKHKKTVDSGTVYVYANAWMVYVVITGNFSVSNGNNKEYTGVIPNPYRPPYNVATWGNPAGRFAGAGLKTDGTMNIINNSSGTTTSINVHTTLMYPLSTHINIL